MDESQWCNGMEWWQMLLGVAGVGIMSIKYMLRGKVYLGKTLMNGKLVIVTGANSGIGHQASLELAERGANVILACRDLSKGQKIAKEIRETTLNGNVLAKELDLASFDSIHRFAAAIIAERRSVDVLLNNAGVFQCPLMRTKEGFEMQMGTNHLGHFLLTHLLLDLLKQGAPSRIVNVGSSLSKRGKIDFSDFNYEIDESRYNNKKGYADSKLANNLFSRELARRLDGTGVTVHCLSPGMARTNLGRFVKPSWPVMALVYPLYWLLVPSALQGAQTPLYCCIDDEVAKSTGRYFRGCAPADWPPNALDDDAAAKLWEISEKLTKVSK